MGTTPTLGLPWPENTEPVTNGWDAIRDLAEAVDTHLATGPTDHLASVSWGAAGITGKAAPESWARLLQSPAGLVQVELLIKASSAQAVGRHYVQGLPRPAGYGEAARNTAYQLPMCASIRLAGGATTWYGLSWENSTGDLALLVPSGGSHAVGHSAGIAIGDRLNVAATYLVDPD